MSVLRHSFSQATLDATEHRCIGIAIVTIGAISLLLNGPVVLQLLRARRRKTPYERLLLSLALSDLGMCIIGYPFSASSSLASPARWLWGDTLCIWYGFTGMLFGSASMGNLGLIAFERLSASKRAGGDEVTSSSPSDQSGVNWRKFILFNWLHAAFWATAPLFGWSRYGYEPSGTTCTLDWYQNDAFYASYVMTIAILLYAISIVLMIMSALCSSSMFSPGWFNLLLFIAVWMPYTFVYFWSVFGDPRSVPARLSAVGPVAAKLNSIVNPLLYVYRFEECRAAIFPSMFKQSPKNK